MPESPRSRALDGPSRRLARLATVGSSDTAEPGGLMKRFGQAIVPLCVILALAAGPGVSSAVAHPSANAPSQSAGRRPATDRRPSIASGHPRLVPADIRRPARAERIPGAARRMVGAGARRRRPPCDPRPSGPGSHRFASRRFGHHRRPDRRDGSVDHPGHPREPPRLARVAGGIGDAGGFGADPGRRSIRRRARDRVARSPRDRDVEGVRSESGRDAPGRVADGSERRGLRRAEACIQEGDR